MSITKICSILSTTTLIGCLLILSGCQEARIVSHLAITSLTPPPIIDKESALDLIVNKKHTKFRQLFMRASKYQILEVFGTPDTSRYDYLGYTIKYRNYSIRINFILSLGECTSVNINSHIIKPKYKSVAPVAHYHPPIIINNQQNNTSAPPVIVNNNNNNNNNNNSSRW